MDPVTADDVLTVQFTHIKKGGYAQQEVDAFLDRIAATLDNDPSLLLDGSMSADDVRMVQFSQMRRGGYDTREVDTFLDRVVAALSAAEAAGPADVLIDAPIPAPDVMSDPAPAPVPRTPSPSSSPPNPSSNRWRSPQPDVFGADLEFEPVAVFEDEPATRSPRPLPEPDAGPSEPSWTSSPDPDARTPARGARTRARAP